MTKEPENNTTTENTNEGKLLELTPSNEMERLLVQLHEKDIDSEEFLGALFNGPMFVLTSEDQIDQKKKALKDNPRLFTLFGDKKQPYVALFTDKERARPIMEKNEELKVLLKLPVGDLLAGTPNIGIVVNPFWDKQARWEAPQIGMFGSMLRREENGLWVRVPDDQLITLMAPNGQPVKMERERFRQVILPQQISESGDDPVKLYNTVMSATNAGLAKDVVESARKLFEIDTIKERGTTALGITLLRAGETDEAKDILEAYLKEEESAVVLTNLAKVYEVQGDNEKRLELLEKALNMNPNMDSALDWYCHIIDSEQGGVDAVLKALDDLEGLAGSWLPALLMGRIKLNAKEIAEAVEHYTDALEVDGHAPEALTFATSELGQAGQHEEVVNLGLGHYDIRRDDPRAGLNILQACLLTKQKEKGLSLCSQMEQIPVPELKKTVEDFKAKLTALA